MSSVPPDAVHKRSVVIAGHRTSVSLEAAFWNTLGEIARVRGSSVPSLIAEVDRQRQGQNLSSAIRVFVLQTIRRHTIDSP